MNTLNTYNPIRSIKANKYSIKVAWKYIESTLGKIVVGGIR